MTDRVGAAVERIAQKHVALNILPEHYPFVADALLGAIGEVLGDAATPEIAAAWGEAYWFLAEILIGREAAVYREVAAQPGGWNGWRDFAVESVVDESSIIRSFTLVPVDRGSVVRHKPGQYLGFALDLPGVGPLRRNYSISCAPNELPTKSASSARQPLGYQRDWRRTGCTNTHCRGRYFVRRRLPVISSWIRHRPARWCWSAAASA